MQNDSTKFQDAVRNYMRTKKDVEDSPDKFQNAVRAHMESKSISPYAPGQLEENEQREEYMSAIQDRYGVDSGTAYEAYKAHQENQKMGYFESQWHYLKSEYDPVLLGRTAVSIRPGLRLRKHQAGMDINPKDKGALVYAALKSESPYFVDENPSQEEIQENLDFGFPKNVAYAMTPKTAQQLYVKGLQLHADAKKYKQSPQYKKDLEKVDTYFQHVGRLQAQAAKGQTGWGVFGTGMIQSITFMAELVGTKGVTKLLTTPAKAGMKVAREAVERTAKKTLAGIAASTVRKAPGSIGRTVLQATVMPQTTIKAFQSMAPHIKVEGDEFTIIKGGERAFNAFSSSLLDTMISVQAEKAGATIEQVGGVLLRRLPTGKRIMSALQKGFKRANPGSGVAEFAGEFFRRAEFHGLFGETAEERLEDWMRWSLGRQDKLLPTMEEWALELGVLGTLKGGQISLTTGAGALEMAGRKASEKLAEREEGAVAAAEAEIAEVEIKEPDYSKAGEAVQAAAKELGATYRAEFTYTPDQPMTLSSMISDPDLPAFTEKTAAGLLEAHDLPADTDLNNVQLVGYNKKGGPILGTEDEIHIAQGGNIYDVVEEVFESNFKNLRPEQQTDLQQELKAYELVNGQLSEGSELERLSDLARAAAFDQGLHKKLGFKLKEIVDKLREIIHKTIRHARMLRSQVKAGNVSPSLLKKLKDVTYQRAIDQQLETLGSAVTPSMLAKQAEQIGYAYDVKEGVLTPSQIKEGVGTAFQEQAVQPTGERIPAAIQQQVARPGEKPGKFAVMGEQRSQSEVEKLRQDVEFWKGKAQTDRLTGLRSKDYAAERLPEVLKQSSEAGKPVSIAFMDLTNFKALNEVYGHEKADKALTAIGQAVREVTRKDRGDELAFSSRYGGDELLLTLPGANAFDADRVVQRVKQLADKQLKEMGMHQVVQEGQTWPISLNEGIVTQQPGELLEASELIEKADLESQKRRAELNKLYGLEPEARFVKKSPEGGELSASLVKVLPPTTEVFAGVKTTKQLLKRGFKYKSLRAVRSVGSMLSAYAEPISAALERISVALFRRLRKFEYRTRQATDADLAEITPFFEKMLKLPKGIKHQLDFALKHGDVSSTERILKKCGVPLKDYQRARKVLEQIHKDAKEVGMDLGYLENFWPRAVKDIDDLRTFLTERRGKKYWSAFEKAIQQKERETGKTLTEQERNDYINQLIRGYGSSRIHVTGQGHAKSRVLETLDEEINNFYFSSEIALVQYIQQMRESIEARKLFGMGRKSAQIEDPIGNYVHQLIKHQAIEPHQERKVVEIFTARFNSKPPRHILRKYRSFEYIETLGSPVVALSQLEDMGIAWYRAGIVTGLPSVIMNFSKAALNKSDIKLIDVGIHDIAAEMTDPEHSQQVLEFVLKASGFKYLDRIGKETVLNTIMHKYKKQAKNPSKDFRGRITRIFGSEAGSVIEAMAKGEVNDNVQYLAFNELLDTQPVALSEMPLKYLQMSDGKVWYILKSFMLRRLNFVLKESLGTIKTNPVQGVLNTTRLVFSLMLMGVGADELKDWITGRQTSLKDQTTDVLLNIAGLSKYNIYDAKMRGGWRAMVNKIAPPFKIIDSAGRDIRDLTTGSYTGSESLASVPLIGKILYWQYGKGAKKVRKEQTLRKTLRKRVGPKKDNVLKRAKLRIGR